MNSGGSSHAQNEVGCSPDFKKTDRCDLAAELGGSYSYDIVLEPKFHATAATASIRVGGTTRLDRFPRLYASTLSCQVERDARSSKPRDAPVFARRSANARIAGMHEAVARGHANPLDPDRLSAG